METPQSSLFFNESEKFLRITWHFDIFLLFFFNTSIYLREVQNFFDFKGKTLRFPMKPHSSRFSHPKCFDCQNAQFFFVTQMIKMSNRTNHCFEVCAFFFVVVVIQQKKPRFAWPLFWHLGIYSSSKHKKNAYAEIKRTIFQMLKWRLLLI